MNFISLTFVSFFQWWCSCTGRFRGNTENFFLLAVSYFFYIRESSWAGGLLLLTTAVTYLAGIAIEKGRHRRTWLIFAVAVCLGLLTGLKYSVPPVGNLILYFPDNGIRDRCISGRDFCGKKSCKLCSVCFILSTAGGRPDREGGESPRTAEGKTYKEPGRSAEWFLADAPGILQKSCRGRLSGCVC